MTSETYFEALSEGRYRATSAVGGAWNETEQHIAMPLGLMVHAVERDAASRREDALQIARLNFDILGTVPVGEVHVDVRLIRPGRTIELVEASLRYQERTIVILRAWLLAQYDAGPLSGHSLDPLPGWDEMTPWDASAQWPGGFIASLSGRRSWHHPGRAQAWIHTDLPLVSGEPVSDFAQFCGLLDVSNGLAVRASPVEAMYPNVDLNASFFRCPEGTQVGYDTDVSFGSSGLGVTHSVIHDLHGPVGVVTQTLTVRRR